MWLNLLITFCLVVPSFVGFYFNSVSKIDAIRVTKRTIFIMSGILFLLYSTNMICLVFLFAH
jgi:hypothetical protein